MIFLEKYFEDTKLDGWSYSFKGIDELIRFMKKNRLFILGKGYRLEIREETDLKIQKYLLKKEGE